MTDRSSPSRRAEPDEYGHLAPLFADMGALDADDPRHAEIRDRLITGYLPLARYLAERYAATGVADEDLPQIASIALIHAIDGFDPGRGADFLSFAIPTISGEVRRHFRDTTWPARAPRPAREPGSALGQARAALARRLGRLPTDAELAWHLDIAACDDEADARHGTAALEEPAFDTRQVRG
jgi:RNA polymerase sigma-B factor